MLTAECPLAGPLILSSRVVIPDSFKLTQAEFDHLENRIHSERCEEDPEFPIPFALKPHHYHKRKKNPRLFIETHVSNLCTLPEFVY